MPVFAFIESGSIDADKLINEVKNQKAREIRYLSKQDFMDKPHRDNPNFYYSVLAETILELSETDKTPSTKTVDDTTLEILDTCQPLVTSKWGQRYPFNQSMKYWLFASYTPQYRKRSPVGCGIVAAAQMMQVVNHPVFSSLVAGYSWSDFNDICKYYNYSSFLYDSFDDSATNTQKTKMAKLAKGLSLIADAFDADYYETSTLVNIFDVKDALVSYDSYYSNAAIAYPNYQMGVLINMLDNGKPAYYRGEQYIPSSNSYEGHAWVVDGYLHVEESWNGGNNTMSYYCLHHNWGWYGLHDGYYTQSSYLASDRFDYDSTVDRSYIDYSDTDNYISTRQFISY